MASADDCAVAERFAAIPPGIVVLAVAFVDTRLSTGATSSWFGRAGESIVGQPIYPEMHGEGAALLLGLLSHAVNV